jgi:hypothetical protein
VIEAQVRRGAGASVRFRPLLGPRFRDRVRADFATWRTGLPAWVKDALRRPPPIEVDSTWEADDPADIARAWVSADGTEVGFFFDVVRVYSRKRGDRCRVSFATVADHELAHLLMAHPNSLYFNRRAVLPASDDMWDVQDVVSWAIERLQ